MTITSAALLVTVGFAAGVVNTLAGGGSFVSLAVLLWLGVPAPLANGTNRVAVLVQSLGAWATFGPGATVEPLEAVVTVAGALAGAGAAVWVPADALEKVLAVAMLAFVGLAVAKPLRLEEPAPPSRWRFPGLFLVAAYGGFAQAGIGLLLVPLLVHTAGLDPVRANARKVAVVTLVSIPALLTFLAAGQVDAWMGAVISVGALVGGVAGARLTGWMGPVWVWRALLVMAVVTAVRAVWPR